MSEKDYIPMPPMPPMPPIPPGGIPPAAASFSSGLSATIASVVTNNPEIEAASCKAVLTTLTGSIIPVSYTHLTLPTILLV